MTDFIVKNGIAGTTGSFSGAVTAAGATLSSAVNFGSTVASSLNDVSRHVNLWGGVYGFNVTGSDLNVVSGGVVSFVTGAGGSIAKLIIDNSGNIYSAGSGTFTGSITASSYNGLTSGNVTTALGFTPANGSNYLALAGGTLTGQVNTNSQIVSTVAGSPGAFRIIAGSYGIMDYSDGTSYYKLITAAGSQTGSYNGLRPFVINLATGAVNMLNGVGVAGGLTTDTLSATSTVSGAGFSNYLASPPAIGSSSQSSGAFTSLSASGAVRAPQGVPGGDAATVGYAFGQDGDTGLFSPIVGGGAGNGIASLFTNNVETLRASAGNVNIPNNFSVAGTVSGTGFSSYLASPPAIGSTTPSTGAFTTLSASGAITGNNVGVGVAGNGYTTLYAGGASNTGYIGFHNAAGTRQGYIGFAAAGTALAMQSEGTATGYAMNGSMTVGGVLTVNSGYTYLNGAAGQNRFNIYQTSSVNRWFAGVNGDPESGGNTGTSFAIGRYTDTGVYIDEPLIINRATGMVSMSDGATVNNGLAVGGTLTAPTVNIDGGSIDNTAIGATTPSTGAFTSLSATGISYLNGGSFITSVNAGTRNPGYQLWTDSAFGLEFRSDGTYGTTLYTRTSDGTLQFGSYPGSSTLQSAFTKWGQWDSGGLTITGTMNASRVQETRTAMSAANLDLNTGAVFTKTISGATTLTVSNVPATGTVGSFILELTNGGSATITWWSGIKWASGAGAPALTAAGIDILGFYTFDGGATWRGLVLGKAMA